MDGERNIEWPCGAWRVCDFDSKQKRPDAFSARDTESRKVLKMEVGPRRGHSRPIRHTLCAILLQSMNVVPLWTSPPPGPVSKDSLSDTEQGRVGSGQNHRMLLSFVCCLLPHSLFPDFKIGHGLFSQRNVYVSQTIPACDVRGFRGSPELWGVETDLWAASQVGLARDAISSCNKYVKGRVWNYCFGPVLGVRNPTLKYQLAQAPSFANLSGFSTAAQPMPPFRAVGARVGCNLRRT